MYYHSNAVQDNQLFDQFTAICKRVDQLSQEDFEKLENERSVYQKLLSEYDITDKSLLLSNNQQALKSFWLVYYLAPFALFGKLIWWLPGRLSIWIANKTVTRIDFYTSVLSGILGVLGVLWWILLISVSHIYLGKVAIALAMIWPIFCYIYMQWKERKTDFFALLRVQKMKKKHPNELSQLIDLRSRIIN
jgi:hypothetical protein